jgi:type IV secretory pathway VirB9-like protein
MYSPLISGYVIPPIRLDLRAFDDGAHVCIEVGPQMKETEAPALLIGAAGGTQLVNYRLDGKYFVVDRLTSRRCWCQGLGASRTASRSPMPAQAASGTA